MICVKSSMTTVAVLTLVTSVASAASIYSSDFEAPEYSVGDVDGQGGGEAGWLGPWVNIYTKTANVSNADANGGTQSLEFISSGGGGSDRVAYYRNHPIAEAGSSKTVSMKFDLNLASLENGSFIIYGLDTTNAVGPEITLVHSGSNSFVDVFRRDGASSTDSGVDVTGGEWHTFELVSDMATSTYSWSVDGVVQETGLGFRSSPAGLERVRFWSTYNNGVSYLDNVVVTAIPEPSTIALMGMIGVLGFVAYRRK